MATHGPVPPHVPPDRVFDFDIYCDPRVDQDVQGSYARILREAPDVFWTPRNGGHWMVRRYDMISEIVADPEHFSCREMQIPRAPTRTIMIPLNLDPPDNVPYRKALMPRFSPKAIQEMEPKLRRRAIEIIEEVVAKGECDFAYDVAARYPVSVFMDMMGLPQNRLREFRSIADQYFAARTEEDYANVDPLINNIMTDLIKLRKSEPGDDLVSNLVAAEVDGRKLVTGELLSMCVLLFLGGMDTVTNVAGFAYQYFAQDSALQGRLAAHPELIPQFVEEALRLYAVVSNPRVVTKDYERFGVSFRQGDMISCVLSLAGRDERINTDPDIFDIDRPKKRHLTFSTGPHLCIGHNLARTELRILTEEWLKRIPSFSPAPDAQHHFRLGNVNALSSLPLRWASAR
jgi:cytochrome P450